MRTFTKSELILLRYVDGMSSKERFPAYFIHVHNLNCEELVKEFLISGLVSIASLEYMLSKANVSQLKEFLKTNNDKMSGSKSVLIARILANHSSECIRSFFTEMYYLLTENGQDLIANGLTEEEYNNRFSLPFSIPEEETLLRCIHQYDFQKAEELIKANIVNPRICHSSPKTYESFLTYSFPFDEAYNCEQVKEFILVCFLLNAGAENTVEILNKKFSLSFSVDTIRYMMKVITSLDELIQQSELAISLDGMMSCVYYIRSCKDSAVCKECRKLDGKKFNIKDAVIGKTYPPFNHCKGEFCRCFASHDIE